MKIKHHHFLPLAAVLVTSATAETIYSGLLDTPIALDFDGTTITINGGTFNPFYGGVGVANNDLLQPARVGTGNLDTILNFSVGDVIGSNLNFSTGFGGSDDHLGNTFTAGQEGYLGINLNGSQFGWIRVAFTANQAGAVIKDWAYDSSGLDMVIGRIQQSAAVNNAQTFTVNPGAGESFTLGSLVTDHGGNTSSLLMAGAGTVTLAGSHTYTGATEITAGTLNIASTGSISNSSSVTIAAGATLLYNSNTALTVVPTLNGDGTSYRATLGGTGPISVALTLDNVGDVLAPGNSTGVMEFTENQSWNSFSYEWEISDFTDPTAGTAFDLINIYGSLELTGGSGSYMLDVLSLTADELGGDVLNFAEIDRSWTIITATEGITGFDAAYWTINTSGFTNEHVGNWWLHQSDGDIILNYSPTMIPEPSSALLASLGMWALLRRRREACNKDA